MAIPSSECPADPNIGSCTNTQIGELCEGDNNECGTNNNLNNCGEFDVYRHVDCHAMVWIGATDRGGSYQWGMGGPAVAYTNWASSQPDSSMISATDCSSGVCDAGDSCNK